MLNQNQETSYVCKKCHNRYNTRRQDVIASGLCPDCFIEAGIEAGDVPSRQAKAVTVSDNVMKKLLEKPETSQVLRDFMRLEEMQLYHVRILGEFRTITTKYGQQQAIDVLNIADNTEYTILTHKVLRNKIIEGKFKTGDEIGIINKGKVKGGSFDYFDFAVHAWDPALMKEA